MKGTDFEGWWINQIALQWTQDGSVVSKMQHVASCTEGQGQKRKEFGVDETLQSNMTTTTHDQIATHWDAVVLLTGDANDNFGGASLYDAVLQCSLEHGQRIDIMSWTDTDKYMTLMKSVPDLVCLTNLNHNAKWDSVQSTWTFEKATGRGGGGCI